MAKRKDRQLLPVQLLQQYTRENAGIWIDCDKAVAEKGKSRPRWSSLCVLPITEANMITAGRGKSIVDFYRVSTMASALYAWRQHKTLYAFDDNLADLLMEQGEDIQVPVDVLARLPYSCVWIDAKEYHFFAWHDEETNFGKPLFQIAVFQDAQSAPMLLTMALEPGRTISQCVRDADAMHGLRDTGTDTALLARLLQLVLYLCAENADMVGADGQPPPKVGADTAERKASPMAAKKWEVGYRVGAAIRKYRDVPVTSPAGDTSDAGPTKSSTKGNTKRPHTRRGHYHHYWVGSEKAGTRRLILKWIAPAFIGGNAGDIVPTQRDVKM